MPTPAVLARVVRSGLEESVHVGSVAIADGSGRLLRFAGDPSRVVFTRSTSKPLQAAVSLQRVGSGASLSDRELAVMAASHTGEAVHVETVRDLLARAGLGEEALACPPALPADADASRSAAGPAPIFHNCSGKHAGMLLACVRSGEETGSYQEPDHPLQRQVTDLLEVAAGGEPSAVGVDGCGMPVHAFPLHSLATAFARLADPAGHGLPSEASVVAAAMRAEPYAASGRGRVCGALMAAVSGLVVKIGAEGLVCAVLLDRELGVAVKIEDGAPRARDAALLRVLGLLDAVEGTDLSLGRFARPPVLGGDRPVGEVLARFDLEHA